ncbi:hypothetical protein GCM10008955_16670 [Deinococcus malanensis]|uniref:Uncharacterized protein n=1 Tax=Deinococcus malanensis TaxID=1706855 RepID=A0ABQ2ES32_9DEIO|nr:hypothetical protein GCM10008955_16670 [Deinococcus malanensis]
MLLQVVAFAGDVGSDFKATGQTHTGNLAQRGVGLLGGGGLDDRAYATAEGAALQGRDFALFLERGAPLTEQLLGGRQSKSLLVLSCGEWAANRHTPVLGKYPPTQQRLRGAGLGWRLCLR